MGYNEDFAKNIILNSNVSHTDSKFNWVYLYRENVPTDEEVEAYDMAFDVVNDKCFCNDKEECFGCVIQNGFNQWLDQLGKHAIEHFSKDCQ